MRPWSIRLSTLCSAATLILSTAAHAQQFHSFGIGDGIALSGQTVVVEHQTRCRNCTVYTTTRAGVWTAPVVSYAQPLPIYQPPGYVHPQQAVPVAPYGGGYGYRRSGYGPQGYGAYGPPGSYAVPGPYAVTQPRAAMLGPRPFYPTGPDAQVITLDDALAATPRRNRRRD